jgi:hypothetical protein
VFRPAKRPLVVLKLWRLPMAVMCRSRARFLASRFNETTMNKPSLLRRSLFGAAHFLSFAALTFACHTGTAQQATVEPLPESERYLGKKPPGEDPEIFPLPVRRGYFAGERIAISADGRQIYYTEMTSNYDAYDVLRLEYVNGKWAGPYQMFANLAAPALSPDGTTLYLEQPAKDFASWTAKKTDTGWSTPVPTTLVASPNNLHNLQVTNDGSIYASSKTGRGVLGESDICQLVTTGSTAVMQSLGAPLNSAGQENDLYVAKDGSYVIFSSPDHGGVGLGDLFISFKKGDGSWTKPKNFGTPINSEGYDFAPYVTADGKYLFFTRSTSPTSIFVCWVRVDRLIAKFRTKAGVTPPVAATR